MLRQLLATDTGHRGPRIDCGAGISREFVGYRTSTIDTVLGPVSCAAPTTTAPTCGRGIAPRDDELGVTGASLSPGLRSMTARAAAAVPFATAADLLAELAGIRLPAKRIERSAETDGAAAAERFAAESAAITRRQVSRAAAPGDRGTRRTSSTSPSTAPACRWWPPRSPTAPARAADGRARTREVKLACLFTQTKIDEQGRPVRDPDSTSYLASFAPAAEFATLVHAEARRRGADDIRQLVVLGDGAPWIWKLATAIAPEATPIVDIYHAREHLHDLAAALAPASSATQHPRLAGRPPGRPRRR